MPKKEVKLSKEEYLQKYLEPAKGKGRPKDNTTVVRYISGDMPDSLDALDDRTKLELQVYPSYSGSIIEPSTVIRTKKKVLSDEQIASQAEKARKKAELEAKNALWNKG